MHRTMVGGEVIDTMPGAILPILVPPTKRFNSQGSRRRAFFVSCVEVSASRCVAGRRNRGCGNQYDAELATLEIEH